MKRKSDKGITLITLIITIIIMLILAGVVINLVIGKNGIINIAKQAGKNYTNAEEDEKKKLDELYSSILVATDDNAQINISVKDLKTFIREEIQNNGGGSNPAGTVISYMENNVPGGYLSCDGSVYNILEYSNLAEQIKKEFGSCNYFGGDGETTFAVPDLRGEFLRGTGTNGHSGNGNGATVGTHQNATTEYHFPQNGKVSFRQPIGSIANADYIKSVSSTNIKGTQSNDSNTSVLYTARPTNTSVLYCIKY